MLEKKVGEELSKHLRSINKKLIKLKDQVEKHISKIVLLEIGEEINKEKIVKHEDMIKYM